MGNTLYLECNAGISGDMTVAALLDLGADEKILREVLDSIPAQGFRIEVGRVKKAGVDCCDFRVILDHHHENHDHDMEYLHGTGGDIHSHDEAHTHSHEEEHVHSHDEAHGHSHEEEHVHSYDEAHAHSHGEAHAHDHTQEHHHHEHRGLPEVSAIIRECRMTDRAKQLAMKIFDILAEAEAKAHDVPKEQVHFHEVGAIDSIVDIVAAAVCIDNLDIREVIVPKLCEGTGTVRCQHGVLPVPVPAVANILEAYHLNIHLMDVSGEFITPTGAAIVAALQTDSRLPEEFRIRKIGMGAGKRSYERPSILRAMLLEESPENKDMIYKLESNVDDCTGENLGYVMECLMAAGARDVHYMPVFMKKNRPAWQINVICQEKDIKTLEQIIFRETTTIGIRRVKMERTVLKRETLTVQTEYGEAQVKVCEIHGRKRYYPEYESVAGICRKNGLAYGDAYRMIEELCLS